MRFTLYLLVFDYVILGLLHAVKLYAHEVCRVTGHAYTHYKLWQSSDGCRQAMMFLEGPYKQLSESRFALGTKRKQLRILVGLTEHIALNRQLSVLKIRTDPLCPPCGEEEETSYHLLGKCCAYMVSIYSTMGALIMEPDELGKVRPTTLLRFARATKRFS